MCITGFYHQEYYLSSRGKYWEILNALDPGSTVKNVFVEAVILLLRNNQQLNNFKDPFEGFFSAVQAFSY